MTTILRFLTKMLGESFGRPAKLIALLEQMPDIRVPLPIFDDSIDHETVVRWHELGRDCDGQLLGWRRCDGSYYESFFLSQSTFAEIGRKTVTENWNCDIQQVHGFAASKSELKKFRSMDDMVAHNSPEMISEITPEALARNLAHGEIRILRANSSDYFQCHHWDGRVFLMNSGGSHHFAAARYIAARLNERVSLAGRLVTYSLNHHAIMSLRRDFEFFLISDNHAVSAAFHDAMEKFGATWIAVKLPRPCRGSRAILLPRSERRSMKVARVLREAGVADLGAYLEELSGLTGKERS